MRTQVKALELMLRVRDRVADRTSAAVTEFCVSEGVDDVRLVSGAAAGECGLESKSELLKVPVGGVGFGDDSACAGELLGSGADGRPNSSIVASAGGAFAGRSRTAEGQCVSAALLKASGRLRQAEAAVVAATS